MATVLELRKAGYSEEEIASWVNTERNSLTNAGYNQVEQSNHFGIPFKSKSKTMNSLIGNPNVNDIVNPLDANLNSTQLQEKEHETTLNVDNNTKEKKDNKIIQYEELLNNNINAELQSKDNVPYKFDQLDKEAFVNRNAINLDVNEKIYDDRGVPVSEEYYKDFTLNEDLITKYSGHTINTLQYMYDELGVQKKSYKAASFMLNSSLKHFAKALTGNEAWGSRSYSWGNGESGMFRMSEKQVQTGLNAYIDILTKNGVNSSEFPYWIAELKDDKDISGLTPDAQTALFLAYLNKQEGFASSFKSLISMDENNTGATANLLIDNYLIPKGIKPKELEMIKNRLVKNLNHASVFNKEEFKQTSMQLPAFGKAMPDFISMAGDNLMGEGRKDSWERGGMQSVLEMSWRLYSDLEEQKKTGKKLDVVKLVEEFMSDGQRWDKRGLAGIRSIAQDLGFFAVGGAIGTGKAAILAATTGGVSIPASPLIITGSAFALHGALRHSLIETYRQNEAETFEGFWDIVLSESTAKVYAKDFALGAGVALGGIIVGKVAGYGINKSGLATTIKNKAGEIIQKGTPFGDWLLSTSKVVGEISALATVPAVINTLASGAEYVPPRKEDFIDAAVVIFGLKAGLSGSKSAMSGSSKYMKDGIDKLYRLYYQTGKSPKEILKDIEKNETILTDILDTSKDMPFEYREQQLAIIKKMNEAVGKNNENRIDHIPKPLFYTGTEVKIDSIGKEKGRIVEVGYEGKEHIYLIEKENGEKFKLAESLVEKWKSGKEVEIFTDSREFESKQTKGEYEQKIDLIKEDTKIFETAHKDSQAFENISDNKFVSDKNGLISSNSIMMFINKHYKNLNTELNKVQKIISKLQDKNITDLIKDFIPKDTNEHKVKLLFKINRDNKLDVEFESLVVDINNKPFTFDLHAYMSLKKLNDNKDAVVTGHYDTVNSKYNLTGEKYSDSGVLIFRNAKGEITGLLMSNKPNQKVNNEANKFKQEFDLGEKEFADTTSSSKGGVGRDAPKWDDINLDKDTNVFRGLELYDLVKMFNELSQGDTPTARKFRQIRGGVTLGKMKFFEGEKGTIEINKDLIDATNKDYRKNLESILMTMSHELGHYIDFIPDATLSRGNVLGRLASLKKYMNAWIAGKEGGEGPFTTAEMAKLRYEAEKTAKALFKKTDSEIKSLGFEPKDILKIFSDAKARELLDPAVYDAYARASTELKKAIIKDAMKDKLHPEILKVLNSGKLDGKNITLEQRKKLDEILKATIQKEVIRRGLVGQAEVMIELKALTQKWKPFNERENIAHTEYRYLPEELMADFMMSFLLRPRETQVIAPIAFRTWMNYMHRKPEVLKVWEETQTELNLPKDQKNANILKDQVNSYRETRMKIFNKAQEATGISDTYDFVRRNVDSVFFTILNYYKRVHEGKLFGSEYIGRTAAKIFTKETGGKRFKVADKENVELAIEKLIYQDTYIERIQNALWTEVFRPMQDSGINRDIFAAYLHFKWVAKPDGPRANVLNPKGIEVIKAGELVALQEKMTPEIKQLAEAFYQYREKYVIKELEKSGVFDEATLQIIRNNREFVTFRIEEYASWKNDSWVQGFVFKTKYGTAKEVANVFEATILKDWQLLQITERNSVVGTINRFLIKYKTDIENFERKQLRVTSTYPFIKVKPITERTVESAKWDFLNKKWIPANKEMDISKFSLIQWTENGKPRAAYMGKEVAHGFDKISQAYDNMAATNFIYGLNAPYRKMFTEINPTFWSYNIFRDTMRTIINLPKTTAFDLLHGGKNSFVKQMVKSWTPAFRQVMKRDELRQDKDAVEMLNNRTVITLSEKYRSRAGGITEGMPSWMSGDGVLRSIILLKRIPKWKELSKAALDKVISFAHKEKSIKDLTKAERELAPHLRDTIITKFENDMQSDKWLNNESAIPPYYKLITSAERVSRVFERTTKIAAFKHLNKLRDEGLIDWTDAQINYAIRNWAGSPNFLRKGNAATLYNNIFLFGNAAKEEWRSVTEAKRYQDQGVWWAKFLTYGVAPQVIYRAAKYGYMGHAAHLYFNLIGNDILASNYVVPLGMINDQGEFEFGMTPTNGSLYKVVYFQFPKDEMVKMFGSAAYHGYNELYGEISDNPLKNNFQELMNGVMPSLDEATPSFSPFFAALKNAYSQFGFGDAPQDPFTGLNIYPQKLQDMTGVAGQWERSKAFGKWFWNNSGGMMFYKFDSYYDPYNLDNIVTEIEKTLGIPIVGKTVGRFLKVSNQGITEKVWKELSEGRQKDNHYSAVADLAVQNLLSNKKLSKSQEEALGKDKGWMKRYTTALNYTYGTKFMQYLLTLEGDNLTRALRKMADIEQELDYNVPFMIKQ
jgi:hypothetical protein